MHLQQTKRGSRRTGGPQYYFHHLSDIVKGYLRKKGAVPVALITPYGATKSSFFAVSADHKLAAKFRAVPGRVGHDRIQQGAAEESIGEAIRKWYALPAGDFERIDVDVEPREDALYIKPLICKYTASGRKKTITTIDRPLTFTHQYISPFWREQLGGVQRRDPELLKWSIEEITRVVQDHLPATRLAHIQETDILRASGPLKHLGMTLGGYVGKGYDCFTEFSFLKYPVYRVPVELKRDSIGFHYQQLKYGKDELSRAVVLCAIHGHKQVPAHIDVIELAAFAGYAPQATMKK
jgi:hypothetical protein